MDQVYFAIDGLTKYGFKEGVDFLIQKVLNNLEGLQNIGAIRENYHPLSGKGLEANHFSWSAAHLMMRLLEEEH